MVHNGENGQKMKSLIKQFKSKQEGEFVVLKSFIQV